MTEVGDAVSAETLLDGSVRIFNGVGLSKQWRWDEILVGADRFGVKR